MSRRLRMLAVLLGLFALLAPTGPAAGQSTEGGDPPHWDPAALQRDVPGAPCTVENKYEAGLYGMKVGDVRYGDKCKRIKFAFGPLVIKPGQNEALLSPTTIEQPRYDGSIVRFKPDMLEATTGQSPPTEDMHLHHATWLGGNYGNGPFFASGEEKTIIFQPNGYGMPIKGDDQWLLLYMVHNDVYDSKVVWITYEIDYVAADDAAELGLVDTKPIWLDVQGGLFHPEAPGTGGNPVFNVQRGFGHIDREVGRRVCTWPKENCARYDTYGMVTPQQGQTIDSKGKPIKVFGTDWEVTEDLEGTLVTMGGHLHFGGIRDEISLVRNGKEKLIHISDALYWNHDPAKRKKELLGGPPTSWDFVMTGTAAPWWKVKIRKGDILRINAVTDSEDASWYEGMGIVMAWVAKDDKHAPEGVDVFEDDVTLDRGVIKQLKRPKGPYDAKTGFRPASCSPRLSGSNKVLCVRGGPTHGPMHESGNHGGGCPKGSCPALPKKDGQVTTQIVAGGFTYGNADMGVIGQTGIPLLRKGVPAKFWNIDAAARIWHTFTRCKEPCTGSKDMDYPAADGGNGSPNDHMDFDSAEIGWGTFIEPASGTIPPNNKSIPKTVQDSVYWEFTPNRTGTYTFFCRIHKGMRGAFKVIE